MIPYTPETATYQAGIIETMTDVGGQICEDIKWQEGQNRDMEISAQENNAPSGEGGDDDGDDEDGGDNDCNEGDKNN